MPVLAVLAAIGTLPEPAILLLLHCLQEELAYDVGLVAGLCSVLLLHHLLELFLIPLVHVVILIIPPAVTSNYGLTKAHLALLKLTQVHLNYDHSSACQPSTATWA